MRGCNKRGIKHTGWALTVVQQTIYSSARTRAPPAMIRIFYSAVTLAYNTSFPSLPSRLRGGFSFSSTTAATTVWSPESHFGALGCFYTARALARPSPGTNLPSTWPNMWSCRSCEMLSSGIVPKFKGLTVQRPDPWLEWFREQAQGCAFGCSDPRCPYGHLVCLPSFEVTVWFPDL